MPTAASYLQATSQACVHFTIRFNKEMSFGRVACSLSLTQLAFPSLMSSMSAHFCCTEDVRTALRTKESISFLPGTLCVCLPRGRRPAVSGHYQYGMKCATGASIDM